MDEKQSFVSSMQYAQKHEMFNIHIHLYITGGRCLTFRAWFMKNTLFEDKKIKLWNTQHFKENKTEIMQHV